MQTAPRGAVGIFARGAVVPLFVLMPLQFASPYTAAESGSHTEVLDLDEVAVPLRVSPEPMRKLAEVDRIPARQLGDLWRSSRAALRAGCSWNRPWRCGSAARVPI